MFSDRCVSAVRQGTGLSGAQASHVVLIPAESCALGPESGKLHVLHLIC